MKSILILFFTCLITASAKSQDVLSALNSGDAQAVALYFDDTIEIAFEQKISNTTKKNAEGLLRNFFREISVKNFKTIHKSGSGNSQYYIGNLTASSGVYRTTIFMKQKGDKFLVQELRFEK